jgi:hypothetical protein
LQFQLVCDKILLSLVFISNGLRLIFHFATDRSHFYYKLNGVIPQVLTAKAFFAPQPIWGALYRIKNPQKPNGFYGFLVDATKNWLHQSVTRNRPIAFFLLSSLLARTNPR